MHTDRVLALALLAATLGSAPTASASDRPLGRLLGGHGGGGHGGHGGLASGAFVGVDGGLAIETGTDTEPSDRAGTFGVSFGYQSRNGLSVFGRYDDLGIVPTGATGRLQSFTAGARFAFPPLLPAPYVEALVGGAFASGLDTRPTGAVGVGILAPIGPVSFDLGVRDLVLSVGGSLRNVVTLQGGVAVVF